MGKTRLIVLLALAIMAETAILSSAETPRMLAGLSLDRLDAICDQVLTSPENLADAVLFLAQNDKKYRCLENCSDNRYKCEKSAKDNDKPGTKKNWEESSKCQIKYSDCMDRCE